VTATSNLKQEAPLWREHDLFHTTSATTNANIQPHWYPLSTNPPVFSVAAITEPQHHDPLSLHFTNGVRLVGITASNVSLVKQLAGMLS
jgi:hypothetical protein